MPEPARRALVTGATGFVGGRLAHMLVDDGWQVRAVVRPGSERGRLPSTVACHVDDGTAGALERAVAAASPSVCFHLAGMVLGNHRPSDVPDLVAANVAFGARLAEALAARPGTLLVNAGTYWQHVDGEPYRPAALYAATKQALEEMLRYYSHGGLLKVVTLKLFDTYGPHDPRPKLLNLLLDAAASGEPLDTSGGEQLVDLVHVDDVCRAFVVASSTFAATPAPLFVSYSVGSGAPISLRDLAAKVEAVTGRRVDARWGARPYRPHEMFEPWDAGPRLPGWAPEVRLEGGIAAMWKALDSAEVFVPR